MKTGPLRTIALCAACAALAGAGSAALAADDDGPATTPAPPGAAGPTHVMRTCVVVPANKAGEGKGEKCTVTSAGAPPPDGKPSFGGCVKIARGTGTKPALDKATRKKLAAVSKESCKVTSDGAPPPGGACLKAEPEAGTKAAADARKEKMAAVAKEKAAAAAAR